MAIIAFQAGQNGKTGRPAATLVPELADRAEDGIVTGLRIITSVKGMVSSDFLLVNRDAGFDMKMLLAKLHVNTTLKMGTV